MPDLMDPKDLAPLGHGFLEFGSAPVQVRHYWWSGVVTVVNFDQEGKFDVVFDKRSTPWECQFATSMTR